jgi:hypothetical protein
LADDFDAVSRPNDIRASAVIRTRHSAWDPRLVNSTQIVPPFSPNACLYEFVISSDTIIPSHRHCKAYNRIGCSLRSFNMKDSVTNAESHTEPENPRRHNVGTWTLFTALMLLLIASGVVGYVGWTISDNDVPTSGYVAMALGVIFSLVVGIGLMALIFYSSRAGYDEPAVLIEEPDLDQDEASNRDETRESSNKP